MGKEERGVISLVCVDYPPPQSLTIEVVPNARPDVRIIKLTGPMTVHNFHDFQEFIRKEPFPRVLLVDLSDVPYIDSAALGSFVSIHVMCEGTERKYALVGAKERLKDLFELSNVTAFLVFYDSMAEAEAQLA
jgi:anti-anti-sigma factor